MDLFTVPNPSYNKKLATVGNLFREVFGSVSDDEWRKVLITSMTNRVIDGVEFPSFVDDDLQASIHGNFGENSIDEAFTFYNFVKSKTYDLIDDRHEGFFLDFAAGWGRISRPFLRDFPLKHMFGYEPNLSYCSLARSCNPFVNFLSGDYLPPIAVPAATFDLVVGWSIFSHLSESSAVAWLKEMSRLLRPGGFCTFTTWGMRFLERLRKESMKAREGHPIHWYSRVCIDAAGSLEALIDQYNATGFVWFTGGGSKLYGEAFLGKKALERFIVEHGIPLAIVDFDTETLGQDAFVLKRR